MNSQQFVGGLISVLGSNYGMSKSEHDKWIKRYGLPGAPFEDPVARQLAAWQKAQYYYGQLGSWNLVAFAWTGGLSNAMKAKAMNLQPMQYVMDHTDGSLRSAASKSSSILQAASTAPSSFGSTSVAPTYVVQTTQVNIPQAPPVNAQGQVDAYLEALAAQQEAADEEASRVNTTGAVFGALNQLSKIAAGSGRMDVSAGPSPTLEPTTTRQEDE